MTDENVHYSEPAESQPSVFSDEMNLSKALVRLFMAAAFVGLISATIYFIFRVDMKSRVLEMQRYLSQNDPKLRKLAAFELWKIYAGTTDVQRLKAGIDDERVGRKLFTVFQNQTVGDIEIRRLLILALGQMRYKNAVDDFIREVQGPLDSSKDIRLASIYSLGLIGDFDAVHILIKTTVDPDPKIRKEAALALGNLGDRRAIDSLKALLSDSVRDVEWGAALALAKLGNSAGSESFHSILDSKAFLASQRMDENSRVAVIRATIKAIVDLELQGFQEELHEVIQTEPNLKVRSEALKALKKQGRRRSLH